jgi:hypothetical protein
LRANREFVRDNRGASGPGINLLGDHHIHIIALRATLLPGRRRLAIATKMVHAKARIVRRSG